MVVLLPVYKFDKSSFVEIYYNEKFVHIVCIISIFLCILPLLEIIPEIRKLFSYGGGVSDSISEMHDMDDKEQTLSPLGHIFMRCVWALYDLCFLFIYPLVKQKKKDKLAILGVFMVFLTCNLRNISTAQRAGSFKFLLQLLVVMAIYWPLLNAKSKKYISKIGFVLITAMLTLFLVVTIARSLKHSERDSSYTLSAFFVRYAGEGLCNYNNYAFDVKESLGGTLTLWLPRKMLGIETPNINRDYYYNIAQRKQKIPHNVFYTFIGFFVLDLGPYLGGLLLIFLSLLCTKLIPCKRKVIPMSSLFLFVMYLKIIEYGPIGYVYSGEESLYIIIYIFLFCIMKNLESNKIKFRNIISYRIKQTKK